MNVSEYLIDFWKIHGAVFSTSGSRVIGILCGIQKSGGCLAGDAFDEATMITKREMLPGNFCQKSNSHCNWKNWGEMSRLMLFVFPENVLNWLWKTSQLCFPKVQKSVVKTKFSRRNGRRDVALSTKQKIFYQMVLLCFPQGRSDDKNPGLSSREPPRRSCGNIQSCKVRASVGLVLHSPFSRGNKIVFVHIMSSASFRRADPKTRTTVARVNFSNCQDFLSLRSHLNVSVDTTTHNFWSNLLATFIQIKFFRTSCAVPTEDDTLWLWKKTH